MEEWEQLRRLSEQLGLVESLVRDLVQRLKRVEAQLSRVEYRTAQGQSSDEVLAQSRLLECSMNAAVKYLSRWETLCNPQGSVKEELSGPGRTG